MSKKMFFLAVGLTTLLLSGCAAEQQAQMSNIGAEQAKLAVLADAGLTAESVQFAEPMLKSRDGLEYYAVSLTAEGQTITYDIDALTGTVIDKQSEAVPVEVNADAVDTISGATPRTDHTSKDVAGAATVSITAEQAKAKALEHAGLAADTVTFVQAKLDYEDGRQVYDVEFYSAKKEFDYEIDAETGAVISYDFDADHYTAPIAASDTTKISVDKAKEIALGQVPGAKTSDVFEFETDYDDGRLAYEGKIIYGGREYEFEIDGYSGAIRSWESEPAGR